MSFWHCPKEILVFANIVLILFGFKQVQVGHLLCSENTTSLVIGRVRIHFIMHNIFERSVKGFTDMVPIIFTFVIVVLILYFSYVTTKWIGGKAISSRGSKYMKILDTLAVTQDKSVIVLQAEEKYLLLSVSPTGIKLITELEDFVPESMDLELEGKTPFSKLEEFKKLVLKYLGKQK